METAALIVSVLALIVGVIAFLRTDPEARVSHQNQIRNVEHRVDCQSQAVNEQAEKLSEVAKLSAKLQEASGGHFWRTASGYLLRIRDMSDNHLENTLKMFSSRSNQEPFLSMKREQERRREDEDWRKKTETRNKARTEAVRKLRTGGHVGYVCDMALDDGYMRMGDLVTMEDQSNIVNYEVLLAKLDLWLLERGGRGISINTVRRKIAELVRGK